MTVAGDGRREAGGDTTEGFEHLADVADVPEGSLLAVKNAAGEEICLLNYRGRIGALHNVCTHAEFPMSDGALLNDGMIECVWHGARYDCRSGAVCRGPAVDPLAVYEVRVEGTRILIGPRVR